MKEEYRFPSNTARWIFEGDGAKGFEADGRKLLYELLKVAETGKLNQFKMKRFIYDVKGNNIGEITASTHFGMHEVRIIAKGEAVTAGMVLPTMLIFFTKEDGESYVSLIDITNFENQIITSKLASSVNISFDDEIRTFQIPFTLADGTKVYQTTANFSFTGNYISEGGYGYSITSSSSYLHDQRVGKFWWLTDTDVPQGPFCVSGNDIYSVYKLDTANYRVYKFTYTRPNAPIDSGDHSKRVDTWSRFAGYNYLDELKPFLIDGDLSTYCQVYKTQILYVGYAEVGKRIYLMINRTPAGTYGLVDHTMSSTSTETEAIAIANAINSLGGSNMSGVSAVASGSMITVTTTAIKGLDVGIHFQAADYIKFVSYETITPLDSYTMRGYDYYPSASGGVKLYIDKNIKRGDGITLIPTEDYYSSSNYVGENAVWSHVVEYAEYTVEAGEDYHSFALRVADDIKAHTYSLFNRIEVEDNCITFYPRYDQMGAFWHVSGKVILVDYYPINIRTSPYAKKVLKFSYDTMSGSVVLDSEETLTASGSGSFFELRYNADNQIEGETFATLWKWSGYYGGGLSLSGSFSRSFDKSCKDLIIYSGKGLNYTLRNSSLSSTRANSYFWETIGDFGGGTDTLTLSDTMDYTLSVPGIYTNTSSWDVDISKSFSREGGWAPFNDHLAMTVDITWKFDVEEFLFNYINFPFSTNKDRPFYYSSYEKGMNARIYADKVYNRTYSYDYPGPSSGSYTITGDMGYSEKQPSLVTPYETLYTAEEKFQFGWIHIQNNADILVQGLRLYDYSTSKWKSMIYLNGVRIEETLATALGTTEDRIMGMLYVPGINNDPNRSIFM